MMLDKEMSIIEAVLLLENEPVTEERLVQITGLSKNIVPEVIKSLQEHYNQDCHGIEILIMENGYLLTPKQQLQDHLKDHYGKKNENKLSKAALETLAIIAYSQPLTRIEVENIRGVSADNMIRQLLKMELIKEAGKKDVPGKPIMYGTTRRFLDFFQIKSIADLPKLSDLDREKFELNG